MKYSLKVPVVFLSLAFSTVISVQAAVAFPNFTPAATTPNQAAIASSLNNVLAFGPAGTLSGVVGSIFFSPPSVQRAAFVQLSPLQYGGIFPGGAAPGASEQTGAVFNRLAVLRLERESALAANVEGTQRYPGILLAEALGDTDTGLLADHSKKLGLWGALTGSMGRQYGDPDGVGYKFNGEGISMGVDYRLSDAIVAGISGALFNTHSSFDNSVGTSEGRQYKYGAYASAASGGWHADAYLGGGNDFFTSRRNIAFLGLTAGSSPEAHEFNMKLGAGYDAKVHNVVLTPFVGFSFDNMSVKQFTENGAGAVDLNVSAFTMKSTKTDAGLRVQRGSGGFRPYLSLAHQHEFEPDTNISSTFSGSGPLGPAPAFVTTLAKPGSEALLAGVGFDALLAKNIATRVGYDGEFRRNYINHVVSAKLRLAF